MPCRPYARLSNIASILALLLIAGLAYLWADGLIASLDAYRSPIRETLPAGPALTPLSEGVVLVIVDGLRLDAADAMPFLTELAGRGSRATVLQDPPSYSETAWTTLMSGASPQLSGAPAFNEEYAAMRVIEADQLCAAATDAGRTVGVSGYYWWEKMIPPAQRRLGFFEPGEDVAADARIAGAALDWLGSAASPDFLIAHLNQADVYGEAYGARSQEYRDSALRVDEHLRAIASRLDLTRQTLIVVADHGLTDSAGHGGGEPAVLRTRLVAAGRGIRVGQSADIRQIDIAPTIAALLGTRIPSRAEGQFAEALLDWDAPARAQAWEALRAERRALDGAYLRSVAGQANLSEAAGAPAAQIAAWDEAVRQAIATRLAADQRGRFWLLAIGAALLGSILAFLVFRKGSGALGPALVAVAGYYALYALGGKPWSFSAVASESDFVLDVAWKTLFALALGWAWALWNGRRRGDAAYSTLRYVGLVVRILALPAIFLIWQIGPLATWRVPDFDRAFLLLMTLAQIMVATAGGALLAGAATLRDALSAKVR